MKGKRRKANASPWAVELMSLVPSRFVSWRQSLTKSFSDFLFPLHRCVIHLFPAYRFLPQSVWGTQCASCHPELLMLGGARTKFSSSTPKAGWLAISKKRWSSSTELMWVAKCLLKLLKRPRDNWGWSLDLYFLLIDWEKISWNIYKKGPKKLFEKQEALNLD